MDRQTTVDRIHLVEQTAQEHRVRLGVRRAEKGPHLPQPVTDIAHELIEFRLVAGNPGSGVFDLIEERHRLQQLLVREFYRAKSSCHVETTSQGPCQAAV